MKGKALPTQQIKPDLGKVRAILRHRRNVHENCLLLGERLIERGESHLARRLITRIRGALRRPAGTEFG